MQPRVLGVGHDAYRAGSQIAFLHVLKWLTAHYDAQFSLLLQSDGALLEDYQKVLPTTALRPAGDDSETSLVGRLRGQAVRRAQDRRPLVASGSAELVYANSSASVGLATRLAAEAGAPVLCHVHELELSMRRFAGGFDAAIPGIARYIAVCDAVKRNLVDHHGVDPDLIDVVKPALTPRPASGSTPETRAALRAELGIASDTFVVGGCGTGDWRKGPDVFLLVAAAVARRSDSGPVSFLWLGGDPQQLEMIRHDIDRLGLSATVNFIAPQADPTPYFELFDVFLLSSREDPFPLVCLEAASLGVPTVCFKDSGGMPEFVESDAGFVVPYLDVDAAADRIVTLVDSPELRARMGSRAAEKVEELHAIEVIGPQIAGVIDRCLAGLPAAPAVVPAQGRAKV